MNKIYSNILIILSVCFAPISAIAADVADRTDCSTIQSRINELSAIETLNEEQSSELNQLQARYRTNCSKSASGRRTSAAARASSSEAVIVNQVNSAPIITTKSVLDDYITKRQNLCDELKTNIDVLKSSGTDTSELQLIENQYNNDCINIDKSDVKTEIDPDTAAANVASGLCTDGSKPNKYGCCEGETFKDIGNLVFACCPDDGGECYPPITNGGER